MGFVIPALKAPLAACLLAAFLPAALPAMASGPDRMASGSRPGTIRPWRRRRP